MMMSTPATAASPTPGALDEQAHRPHNSPTLVSVATLPASMRGFRSKRWVGLVAASARDVQVAVHPGTSMRWPR